MIMVCDAVPPGTNPDETGTRARRESRERLVNGIARLPARSCRGHLIVRWTPSETGATQATSAATEARL